MLFAVIIIIIIAIITWILSMQHDGGVGHSEPVVLDVHLVGGGELGVVEDLVHYHYHYHQYHHHYYHHHHLVLAPRHVPDTVLHLREEI